MKKILLLAILIIILGSCEKNDERIVGEGEAFVSGGKIVPATTKFDMSQFFNLVDGKEWVLGHEFYYDKSRVGGDLSKGNPGFDKDYFNTYFKFGKSGVLHRFLDERLMFFIPENAGAPAFEKVYYQEFVCEVNIAARTLKMTFPGTPGVAKHILCWQIIALDADRIIMDQTSTFAPKPVEGFDALTFGHRVILTPYQFSYEMREAKECKPHWAYCLDYMKKYDLDLWEKYKDNDGYFLYKYM